MQVPVEVGFPSLDYQKHKILTAPTAILDGESFWPNFVIGHLKNLQRNCLRYTVLLGEGGSHVRAHCWQLGCR